jgi:hypothetical protein
MHPTLKRPTHDTHHPLPPPAPPSAPPPQMTAGKARVSWLWKGIAIALLFGMGVMVYRWRIEASFLSAGDLSFTAFASSVSLGRGCNTSSEARPEHDTRRVLIMQCDSRPPDSDLLGDYRITMGMNREICREMGYEYRFALLNDSSVPPFWGKIFALRDALHEGRDRYSAAMFLDSDAVLYNASKSSIEGLLAENPDKSFVYCNDPPLWNGPFDAAVFIVRNDEMGRLIMDSWADLYDNMGMGERWKRMEPVKQDTISHLYGWTCPGCIWAGAQYEQGSFSKYILPVFKKHLLRVSPWVFMMWDIPPIETALSIHFPGGGAKKLIPRYQEYLKLLREGRADEWVPIVEPMPNVGPDHQDGKWLWKDESA